MSGFSKREDAFENKFAFDAEKRFKVEARRNKLLAQWVGQQAKMTPQQIEQYAVELIQHDLKKPGDADVLEKVIADLKIRGVTVSQTDARAEMSRCIQIASEQTANEG
ncbi:MAG: DUF1476 domain-containing protein [Planctomycetota bacterium]|nr:DUF1476 domain-containing protein [Planctomycetota bacterium]